MQATVNGELGIGIAYDAGALAGPSLSGYDFLEVAPRAEVASLRRSESGGGSVLCSDWVPVGGSCEPDSNVLALLAENVALQRPAYVVEQLGFNRFSAGAGSRPTGFVLPAPRTPAGAAVAAKRLVSLRDYLGTPVAFEIGPRYLSERPDDLCDAAFAATLAQHADCGIVLDLTSVWAERNGDASATLLDGLPLERIWEVQIPAAAASDIRRFAERIVPRLPALRALIYHVRPESLRGFGARALQAQRDWLADLWRARGTNVSAGACAQAPGLPSYVDARVSVAAWERSVVMGIAGITQASGKDAEFLVLAKLVATARKTAIAAGAELSLRLLEATLGRQAFADLLARYCAQTEAQAFPETEAMRFLQFVERERTDVPYLREVVAFERAASGALHGAGETAIHFPCEPTEIFRALLRHDRPYVSDRRPHVVHVGPRSIRIESDYGLAG
jgi:hypothetical protein